MNFNNYTIKSQEAIQQAQQLAQGLWSSTNRK